MSPPSCWGWTAHIFVGYLLIISPILARIYGLDERESICTRISTTPMTAGWILRRALKKSVSAKDIRGAPDNDRRLLPMADMTAAIEYVHPIVPPGTPLFVDYQTREVLSTISHETTRIWIRFGPKRSRNGLAVTAWWYPKSGCGLFRPMTR